MRIQSGDTPTIESRRIMGTIRNQITANLYRVTIDNATVSASTFQETSIPRGTRVPIIWHPERNFWEIEFIPSGGYWLIVALGSAVGISDPQMYKTFPFIPATGLGDPVDGPTVVQYDAAHDIAPNGRFMVATTSNDYASVGLFLWNGTGFDSTPVDTISVAQAARISISPDSSTVALGLNGSPYLQAFPVSTAGFGAAYANPATLPPGGTLFGGVDWHPSGLAVAHGSHATGVGMTLGVWAFNAGWGSKYAAPADAHNGGTADVRFSPDGDFLFAMSQFPLDSADGQFRLYPFDLTTGFGTRVAASASPLAGPIEGDQFDFNGSLLAVGSDSQYGFITYTFDGATIGPGVTNYFPADEFDYAWHLKFSPDGLYLAATAPTAGTNPPFNVGRVTVFSVASDGTLTQVGTTYIDTADGDWPYVKWRQT